MKVEKQKHDGELCDVRKYDSLYELSEYVRQIPSDYYMAQKQDEEFYGAASLQAACDQASLGVAEETQLFYDDCEKLKSIVDYQKSGYRYDFTGDFFDVGRVIQNHPKAWFRQDVRPVKPAKTIVIQVACLGKTSAKHLRNRGVAIAALIDYLSDMYTLDVWFIRSSRNSFGGRCIGQTWVPATKPLDLDSIRFLCSTAFYRMLCFADQEMAYGRGTSGDSRSVDLPDGQLEALGVNNGEALYFGCFDDIASKFATVESAAKYVQEVLKDHLKEHGSGTYEREQDIVC